MSDSIPKPINVDELLKRCMGQVDFAQEILDDFLLSCERGIENIRCLDSVELGSEQMDRIRQEAHRLKGTSATVAATQLSELFQAIEANISSGDPGSAIQFVPSIESEFENVRQFVASGQVAAG